MKEYHDSLVCLRFLIVICVVASLGFIKFTQVKSGYRFLVSLFLSPVRQCKAQERAGQSGLRHFQFLGELKAPQSTALRNELEGIVEQVNIKPGQPVTKGQLLIQLNVQQEKSPASGSFGTY